VLSAGRRITGLRRRLRPCWGALAGVLLATGAAAATPPNPSIGLDELRRDRRMADDLYKATTSDAAAFEKALRTPALRAELEQTLNRKLSDDTLTAMASHARAEADYWASYRAGIDHAIGAARPAGRRR
jgi:hypothetical protein